MQKRVPYFLPGPLPTLQVHVKSDDSGPGKIDGRYALLVDSGASICVFDKSIIDDLDLNFESGTAGECLTASGKSVVGRYHAVQLKIDAFGWHLTTALFVENLSLTAQGVFGVLGIAGFFDRYRVTVDNHRRSVALAPF